MTPLDNQASVAAQLRLEVAALRRRESRRVFDAAVSVGLLGGAHDSFVVRAADLGVVDTGLQVDLVCGLLESADPGWCAAWLTRAGEVDLHDVDLAWMSAARRAFAIHERELVGFYVVTRHGWRDMTTGQQRVWKRLRV